MADSTTTPRTPLFSRGTLLVVAFLSCFATLVATWLVLGRQWVPTLPLPAVLLTLLVVLPVGNFIRNRFRLSLRAILLIVSIAAVLLGLFGTRWNQARRQRRAVMSVMAIMNAPGTNTSTGQNSTGLDSTVLDSPDDPSESIFPTERAIVSVRYNKTHEMGNGWVKTPEGTVLPAWLVEFLGDDFFFKVDDVSIQLADLTAADAFNDVDLTTFDSLYFNGCKFGKESFEHLVSTAKLRSVSFSNCEITDAQLKILAEHQPALETLRVTNFQSFGHRNNVTGEGIKEIANIESLQQLELQNLSIGPGDLQPLIMLKNLKWLQLPHNGRIGVDDAMIVREMPELRGIGFAGTRVDETFIPVIRSLPQLEWATIAVSSAEVEKRLVEEAEANPSRPMIYFR